MDIQPDEFGDAEFIEVNKPHFDRYITNRVQGVDSYTSFIRAFGLSNWVGAQAGAARITAIEGSPYYVNEFKRQLDAAPIDELWGPKVAVNELLQLVRGQHIKDSVKLGAAKELNLIVGIVVVDENGKSKAGRTLADFYADVEAARRPIPKAAPETPVETF